MVMESNRTLSTGNGNVPACSDCRILDFSSVAAIAANFLAKTPIRTCSRLWLLCCFPSSFRSLLRGTSGALRQLALLLRQTARRVTVSLKIFSASTPNRRSIQVAHKFLTRCFVSGECIALLLRRENPVTVIQRVVLYC